MKLRHPVAALLAAVALVCPLAKPSMATELPVIVLATTEDSTNGVRVVDGQLDAARPGHYVELARKVGELCGARVEFEFMPWARALRSVESGKVSAAFAASYKPERAVYGVYPMHDGQPDPSRAQRSYAYHLYARPEVAAALKARGDSLAGEQVAVERDSSVIPLLESLGMIPVPLSSYENMLTMIAMNRVRLGVGIADNFDVILERTPRLSADIARIDPPLQKQVGYVMFGKAFHERHRTIVECFWTESAVLSRSAWYRRLKLQYGDGTAK